MAWKGEAENSCYGIAHKAICPLLKQWRQVAKGKATAESAGLREAMVECLRAAVTGVPGGGREGSRTACGVQPCAVC